MVQPLAAAALLVSAGCAIREPVEQPARVPFADEHGLVFVEVDAPVGVLLALLDTGANASAIDPGRAQDRPVTGRTEVVGTTGTLPAELVDLSGLRLGTRPLPALRATRRPLAGLLAPSGRRVDMILGSDAFANAALTIDFAARELTLGPSTPGGGVPMRLDQGIPAIEASLAGLPVELRIDTGASLFATDDVYVNVPTAVWQTLRERDSELRPTTHFRGTGADGGTVDLPVAPIGDVTIGPAKLARAFVIVQPEAGYFADPRAKGFVGNNFLRRLRRVTLDYGAGRLRSQP